MFQTLFTRTCHFVLLLMGKNCSALDINCNTSVHIFPSSIGPTSLQNNQTHACLLQKSYFKGLGTSKVFFSVVLKYLNFEISLYTWYLKRFTTGIIVDVV